MRSSTLNPCLLKPLLKTQRIKRTRNYVLKHNLYLYLLIKQKLLIFDETNADVSWTEGVCHVIHISFESSLCKL